MFGVFGLYIRKDAHGAVRRSAARYLEVFNEVPDQLGALSSAAT
jgi:hypothetical protein